MRWIKSEPKGWHVWFAWYPVEVGKEYVWLELIERRDINEITLFKNHFCNRICREFNHRLRSL